MKRLMSLLLCCALLLAAAPVSAEITAYTKCGTHGSAKRLRGRTAIVSVFADDTGTGWDFDRRADYERYGEAYHGLRIACEWISAQARTYGVRAEFDWDWYNHSWLYFRHTFPKNMVTYDNFDYSTYFNYIAKQIPTEDILRKSGAENILYIFFFNTPRSNPVGSYACPYAKLENHVCGYEIVCMFTGLFGHTASPGVYAHEILHLYGVPDLYSENLRYNATEKFIRDYQRRYPRDIMGGAAGSDNHTVVEYTFSPLVAYYAGLTSSAADVGSWGLRRSDYELYGY